jgi:hypothetical protein
MNPTVALAGNTGRRAPPRPESPSGSALSSDDDDDDGGGGNRTRERCPQCLVAARLDLGPEQFGRRSGQLRLATLEPGGRRRQHAESDRANACPVPLRRDPYAGAPFRRRVRGRTALRSSLTSTRDLWVMRPQPGAGSRSPPSTATGKPSTAATSSPRKAASRVGGSPLLAALFSEGEAGLVGCAVAECEGQVGAGSGPCLVGCGEVGVAVERGVVGEAAGCGRACR